MQKGMQEGKGRRDGKESIFGIGKFVRRKDGKNGRRFGGMQKEEGKAARCRKETKEDRVETKSGKQDRIRKKWSRKGGRGR
jgi:hypothetical protein